MSQIVTRKGGVGDEKEKRTDSPVKDLKKKMGPTEKDKPTQEKPEKKDKPSDKATDKKAKDVPQEKNGDNKRLSENKTPTPTQDKNKTPTQDKNKTPTQDKNKTPTPTQDKSKTPTPQEKKANSSDKKEENGDKSKTGQKPPHNGTQTNGTHSTNGTVSVLEETLDSDTERDDECFPELAYDDDDDDNFENSTPEGPSRSFTRRSQMKSACTPETPRPASDKQTDNPTDEPKDKDSKVLKLNDVPERKTRSTDSDKKIEKAETPKTENSDSAKDETEKQNGKAIDVEIVVEVAVEGTEEPRSKTDTNFSKSRVKVSPYRRSGRIADQTNTSMLANYTGNNTTMEMDITETSTTSILDDTNSNGNDSYLNSLRGIKGRRSYKNLAEMPVKKVTRRTVNVNISGSEVIRPTAPVVGRKRKPETEDVTEMTDTNGHGSDVTEMAAIGGKRARLFDSIARTFTRTRHTEIVGINTDLPLSVPIATEAIETPENIKHTDKRCNIM